MQEEVAVAIQKNAWGILQGTDRLWELVQRMIKDLRGYDRWMQNCMGRLKAELMVMLKPALIVHLDGWREYRRVEEV